MPRNVLSACLLSACLLPAQEATPPIPDAAVLERQYTEAQQAWNQALREARDQKEERDALLGRRPEAVFVPQFQQGARAHAGTPQAVPYLVWLVSRGDEATARAAMQELMERHVADPGIGRAVARIGGLRHVFGHEQSRAWLDRVLQENADAAVQLQARYTRAAGHVGTRAVSRSEELRQLAIADLKAVLADSGSDSLRGLATGLLHEAEHLEPGLPAPDIEGEDLDGVAFRLSDYRGKVVLLDFWGDW